MHRSDHERVGKTACRLRMAASGIVKPTRLLRRWQWSARHVLLQVAAVLFVLVAACPLGAQSVTLRLDSAASQRDARVLAWLVDRDGRSAAAGILSGEREHTLEALQAGPHALCARRTDGFTFSTPWFELHDGERFQLELLVPTDSTRTVDVPVCANPDVPVGVFTLGTAGASSTASTARGVRVRLLDAATYAAVPGAQLAIRPPGASEATGAVSDSGGQAVTAPIGIKNDGAVTMSIRALGYSPRFMTLTADALRSTDSLIVMLTPLPQRLAGVRVEGERPLPRGLDRRTMAGWTVSEKVMREVRLFARNFGDFVQWQGLAGVRVQGGACVRIRNDGCALVVVDGIPRDPQHLYIDPLMIEQIVVLRAIDASTLFGAQGVNGAVLITTSTGERRNER